MPNFNYENPTNALGNPMESPEDHMFKMVLEIVVSEGYSNLSFGKLKKKGVEEDLLKSYKNKKNVFHAAFEDWMERIVCSYEKICEQAREYIISGNRNKEEGWRQLERLLYRHIYLCFHPKNRNYVLLTARENMIPYEYKVCMTETLSQCFGEVLTELILDVSEVKNRQMAAMLTCTVCAGIHIFVQQPEYCKKIYESTTRLEPNYAVIEDFLNDCFLRTIAVNTAINKPF